MSTIEIKVTGRELSFINMPTISAGAVGADSIKFEFESPSVWDGYIKYCVVFKNRSQYCPEALDNSNIAQISSNMLSNEGILYIGLCGYKDATRLTSTIVSYEIKNGVYCIHSSEEEELAKTKFEQILEYYDATLREQQAINERLDKIEKAPFNVKLFGAKGNGIDDDADAIQSAINAARDAGGGTVFFPSGTYYFSHTVTFASNIKLQGDVNTVFTADKVSGTYTLRSATFLEIGTPGNTYGYAGFSNVEINNIIFDLGGQWSLNDDILTYKAKYKSGAEVKNNGFYTYCPIVACHGDGFRVINCTFKNGIYGGYTGSRGTNPHVMDIGGVKNILIEGCTFEPVFVTATAISKWSLAGEDYTNSKDTEESNATASDVIQLDACYDDGGDSGIKGKRDGTNCRDVVIRNNKFYGLPHYDWKKVVNNTGDNDITIRALVPPAKDDGSEDLDAEPWIHTSFAAFRFMPVAAIGTCHDFSKLSYQPQNVEIYDNYFEGSWSSHYNGVGAKGEIRWGNYNADHSVKYIIDGVEETYYYPLLKENGSPEMLLVKDEPARSHCHGAIYAYPGAKGYHIHNNTFKETVSCDNNVSTAVFLYGSLAGTVHDNIFIEYGEPLPMGEKKKAMGVFNFEDGDAWSKDKIGYYDGPAYCKSSNNIWIKDGELSAELDCLEKIQDIHFEAITNSDGTTDGYTLSYTKTNGAGSFNIRHGRDGVSPTVDVEPVGNVFPDLAGRGYILSMTDTTGTAGCTIYNGKSAYELAIDNGFEGSEAEWLESLQGKDADGADFMETEFTDNDKGKFVHIGTNKKPELVNLLGNRWKIGTDGLDIASGGCEWFYNEVSRALMANKIMINVKYYGATGNGRTDDGWAIQEAIDQCNTLGGGTIYFPQGVYNITRTLFYYSNMTFKFEAGATIRTMTDAHPYGQDYSSRLPSIVFAPYFETEIAYLNGTDGNGVAYGTSGFASNRYGVENVVFDGGTISGYSWFRPWNEDQKKWEDWRESVQSVVMLTCLCKNIKFYNMTFDGNSGGHSIEINSSTDVTVRDCRFLNFIQGGGSTQKNDSGSFTRKYDGGMYAENLQIDAATSGAVGSKYKIVEQTGTTHDGFEYEKWYLYQNGNVNYRSLGGYFDFTLLPPGDQYYRVEDGTTYDYSQSVIDEKLNLSKQTIGGKPGFHQCCHNIEIASCYFENNSDDDCFVSAIGCHTSFRATNEGYANADQDKHTGIKIHDNTFIWATNHYHNDRINTDTNAVLESVKNNPSYWRGVIAFGTNESTTGKKFEDVHVYNVSIHGNMFYRNKDCLTDEGQEKIGYAITTNIDSTRYTREDGKVPQSKYKVYGNFYAGINGWESGTSSEIYKEGSSLVITDGVSMPVQSGNVLTFS